MWNWLRQEWGGYCKLKDQRNLEDVMVELRQALLEDVMVE